MMLSGGKNSGNMRILTELRRKISSIPPQKITDIFCRIRASKKLHITFNEERGLP